MKVLIFSNEHRQDIWD